MLARLALILIALLTCAMVVTACGSDDSSSKDEGSDTKQASSKDDGDDEDTEDAADSSDAKDEDDDTDDEAEEADDAEDADAKADAVVMGAYAAGMQTGGQQLIDAGTALDAATDWPTYSAALTKLRAAVATFKALTPPKNVEFQHEELVSSLEEAVAHASKVTETSDEAADELAIAAASESLTEAGEAADAIAAELGA